MISLQKRAVVFGFAALLSGAFLIDFCGWIYGCGCQSVWKVGALYCNIHTGPKHCPWCTHGGVGFAVTGILVFGTQAWIAFRAAGPSLLVRLGMCIAAFPLVGGLVAYLVGSAQGYWTP